MMFSALILGMSVLTLHATDRNPVDAVEARGELADRLERAYARLQHPPLSDPAFVLSDINFHFKRRFTEYSGDVSGRVLGALNASVAVMPSLPRSIETSLKDAIPRLQKADGHFGVDQDLAKEVNQERDMPILWGNARLLLALAECCKTTPDDKLLACARKLGDYLISARPYYGKKENFEGVGGSLASGFTTCYPSWIDGLVALGELTGEAKYLEEAAFIARLSLLDQAMEHHHSHGRLIAYRGMLDLDRVTGKHEFTDAVAAGCARIEQEYLMPVGGVTEIFDLTYDRDEGCSEVDWIRVNVLLWRATGKSHYLDVADNALRNHLMAMQFENGGFGHHKFGTLQDGDKKVLLADVAPFGSEAYWCCTMHGTELLADVARYAVFTTQDALWITWLGEVRANAMFNNEKVTITLHRKSSVEWTVVLEAQQPGDTDVKLRVPGWAKSMTVDGHPVAVQDGWATVQMSRKKQTLSVCFDHVIRIVPSGENGPARVYAGPDLYCLPDNQMGNAASRTGKIDTILLGTDPPASKDRIPVLVETAPGKYQQASLVPLVDRPHGGCRLLMNVRPIAAAEWKRLNREATPAPKPGIPMKLAVAVDGEYEIFVNGVSVFSGNGCVESPEVEVYGKHQNTIAVKATCNAAKGFIGLLDGKSGTTVQDWSAVACPKSVPGEWLTDEAAGKANAVTLQDLGPWGIDPWKHMNGRFAETGARWIWPENDSQTGKPTTWLFRCTYHK